MKRFLVMLLIMILGGVFVPLTSCASIISGGVSESELVARTWRDGAYEITFIDLTHRISADGWLTKWSFYAQYYSAPGFPPTLDPRKVQLKIFRDPGALSTVYQFVGQSPMVNVDQGWDKVYSFDLANIPVKKDDIIGWYYPTLSPETPGGVIAAAQFTGTDTRWVYNNAYSLGNIESEVSKVVFPFNGEWRTYSIRVEGTDVAPVPLPTSLLLLAPGLAALAMIRRKLN